MRITLEGDDRQTLIARLGLSKDASDADIQTAVTARILAEAQPPAPSPEPAPTPEPEPEPEPTPEPEPVPDDDDQVVVDAAAYRDLVARADRTEHLEEEARVQARDTLIATAIRQGKFPPSRRAHYQERYDTDPEATTAAINRMRENVVPVKERGKDVSEEDLQASDAYPQEWLAKPGTSANNGAGGSQEPRRSRVITED